MLISFHEDDLDMLRVAILKLLLQVAAAVLVFAQAIDLSLKLLQLNIAEAGII